MPQTETDKQKLVDHFVAAALTGLLSSRLVTKNTPEGHDEAARWAINLANAMVKLR